VCCKLYLQEEEEEEEEEEYLRATAATGDAVNEVLSPLLVYEALSY
jgi:hypothetical protein